MTTGRINQIESKIAPYFLAAQTPHDIFDLTRCPPRCHNDYCPLGCRPSFFLLYISRPFYRSRHGTASNELRTTNRQSYLLLVLPPRCDTASRVNRASAPYGRVPTTLSRRYAYMTTHKRPSTTPIANADSTGLTFRSLGLFLSCSCELAPMQHDHFVYVRGRSDN